MFSKRYLVGKRSSFMAYVYKPQHAIKRVKERYGIDITEADCLEIAELAHTVGKPQQQLTTLGFVSKGDIVRRINWRGVLMDVMIKQHADKEDNPWILVTAFPKPKNETSPCFTSERAQVMYDFRKKHKLV